MRYTIQSIVLPTQEKHFECKELFYKAVTGILDDTGLSLGFAQHCDFVTYLNACSWGKWKAYTMADNLQLDLEIEGAAKISLIGYQIEDGKLIRLKLAENEVRTEDREKVTITCPENDSWLVGFEIVALSQELQLYGGGFSVEVNEEDLNNVTLSLASTTYQKEEFIQKTVDLLKREIFEQDSELAQNLYIHIVDNGQTLGGDFCTDHIFLHPAKNTGGSGGFSRGMIEALHQNPQATHVLLMDDDVLVLPESIKRTYNLLKLLKSEYRNDILAGAMLDYDMPYQMHEDVGTVDATNNYQPSKPERDLRTLESIVLNEEIVEQKPGSYSAWWFSCIPVAVIKEHGLSLPIFVRGDDTEYGVRTGAHFLTMDGICVWHMGFTNKTNLALKYFGIRNCLIMYATTGVASRESVFSLVRDTYHAEMLRFNYAFAEIVIQAFEDYLAGPDHLKDIDNAERMKQYSAINPRFKPLSELGEKYTGLGVGAVNNSPLSISDRLFMKLTTNGQKHTPRILCGGIGVNILNQGLSPRGIIRRNEVLVIDPETNTGTVYQKDKQRFRELDERYQRAMKCYKVHGREIEDCYREARSRITSEEYWMEYLGLVGAK